MDIESAVETLSFLVETPDEQEALRFLVNKAQQAELGDVASSKQVYFINSMAQAAGVEVGPIMEDLGMEPVEDPRKLPKKDATKLIKTMIDRGYKDMLPKKG
jgi:hypothetical protein